MNDSTTERERLRRMFFYERETRRSGYTFVAGVDEAGRGPLAGPVVAAAVIFASEVFIPGLDDSKRLSPHRREILAGIIRETAAGIGVGMCSPQEIDRWNILQASLLAMRRAVENLEITPDLLIVDGNREIPDCPFPQMTLVKGDQKSASVAAASIIAKVQRDDIMRAYHRIYPRYGFDRHKGYPSKAHREAILKYGLCDIHRRSFHIKPESK